VVSEVIEVVDAVIVLKELKILTRNQVEVKNGLREAWRNINIPVGCAISNHKTLEVNLGRSICNIMLVDLPSEIGDVNAGVALSRYVQGVW